MSGDTRIDVGSSYPFRIEASDTKRVRVLNMGPASLYYDASNEVSDSVGTELASGASADFANIQWIISAGSSRIYVYYYDQDDIIDSFEIRGGSTPADSDEPVVFKPDGVETGDSIEWDGSGWVPAVYSPEVDITGKADSATVLASGLAYVFHGATAGTARPTGFAGVIWVGSVEPTLAVNNDVWIDTTP
jgi:hypothetical protein